MTHRYGALFTGSTSALPEPAEPGRPYRLLFVDDDPHILSALRRVFHRENYELRFAESAEAALDILEGEAVEVVISDFKMPGMDGNALLQIVRKRWPRILRIMLTGYANSDVVLGSMKEGAVYHFNLKPWNDDDLRLTVALALEQYETRKRRGAVSKTAADPQPTFDLDEIGVATRSQLAHLLHSRGMINARQLQRLHGQMQNARLTAIQGILSNEWLDANRLYAFLRDDQLCEEIDLREVQPNPSLLPALPFSTCERQWVFPSRLEGGRLDLAMADPLDTGLIDALAVITGYTIRPLLCRIDQLTAKLEETAERYGWLCDTAADEEEPPYEEIEIVLDDWGSTESLQEILTSSVDPPAIRLVNGILLEAVKLGARGILIQPRLDAVSVRYRLNGLMQDTIQVPTTLLVAVVSRLKVMAELDVAEQQSPQEGHIIVKTPMNIVEMTVSTLPTAHGEQVYITLAPRNSSVIPLHELGLSQANLQRLEHAFAQPRGMILAAGPADSGKTMLLHALLKSGGVSRHHIALEQPMQYVNEAVSQSRLLRELNDSTSDMLDAVLAQSPEVVLIDDHRDARIIAKALRTAVYEGKVLTAMSATSIADVFTRLLVSQANALEIASGLEALVMQRLVRRLCTQCRRPSNTDAAASDTLGGSFTQAPKSTWQAVGCNHCHRGYRGRTALHEVILLTDALRSAIASGHDPWQLQALARSGQHLTLLDDAHAKVSQGLTTTEEVLRVLGPQPEAVQSQG
ncbi:Flp pilus assembly complex ATPase component TadA [Halomonas sp. M5N1S17]|uniref:ATPase, T2SS/T4P/T4SS family n=1 Tax=Halomonas alkalisoli TaxID=2907158 RepID=UPI001F38CF00|nr:ATPase, T2SS/T4P/T4SS family [Halomonas alkalisoli]MCE9665283.1 Flp pilus assembly complex ATPase component TadA [Halomonas alkalisoli]